MKRFEHVTYILPANTMVVDQHRIFLKLDIICEIDFSFRAPGGFGSPVDRHKDRSARSVLNRGGLAKRAKHPSAEAAGNPVLELSHRGRSRWRVPQA
jgi:hypothetical protein